MNSFKNLRIVSLLAFVLVAGCARKNPETAAAPKPPKHEHHPPHGGTPVVLGDEIYHLELVLDPAAGKLQAFILDGEMENFIRSAMPSFDVVATVAGRPKTLTMKAVINPATGETVGDTSLFETQADWLKNTQNFDAVLTSLTIRGTTFSAIKFNFPAGNDDHAK